MLKIQKVKKLLFLGHFNDDFTLDMRYSVNKGRDKESPAWSDYWPSPGLCILICVLWLLWSYRRREYEQEMRPRRRPERRLSDDLDISVRHIGRPEKVAREAKTTQKRSQDP